MQSDHASLTELGVKMGGQTITSPKFGSYLAFPDNIMGSLDDGTQTTSKLLTVTKLGIAFNMSAQNVNAVLSELGWTTRAPIKGWLLTKAGANLGAIQKTFDKTGIPYVLWPENIIDIPAFTQSIQEYKGESSSITSVQVEFVPGFRDKFEAKHRAQDGHFVRSRAEVIIDNWLYIAEISHAYERKLPIQEDVYCDFYIPSGRVYI